MEISKTFFYCFKNKTHILQSIHRYTCLHKSSLTSNINQHCRFHHFLSSRFGKGSELFQYGAHNVKGRSVSWLQRTFRTRRTNSDRSDRSFTQHSTGPTSTLLKPFIFTVAVTGGSFLGAMIWQYETMRYHAQRLIRGMQNLEKRTRNLDDLMGKNIGFRAQINSMWQRMNPGQKMVMTFIAGNVGVFLLWRVKAMMPLMSKYFSSSPGAPVVSMVLCACSHYGSIHLLCNMYVLWSFSSVSLHLLGKEQFAALFVSAAAVSSFASLLNKTLRGRSVPSLGASGAIMALLGVVCFAYPNSQLSIAFIGDIIPHSFSANSALIGILALDTAGLLLGWKLFDHAAHLGGMLFGLWYIKYGKELIWGNRENVMKLWHDVRGKP